LGELRTADKIVVVKPVRAWEDNIKMESREVGCEGVG
jgi:hypothetical protein